MIGWEWVALIVVGALGMTVTAAGLAWRWRELARTAVEQLRIVLAERHGITPLVIVCADCGDTIPAGALCDECAEAAEQ